MDLKISLKETVAFSKPRISFTPFNSSQKKNITSEEISSSVKIRNFIWVSKYITHVYIGINRSKYEGDWIL